MKKRFSEEQIIRMLKEDEAGEKAADIVREYNISEQTFYRWKSKYGGMDVLCFTPEIDVCLMTIQDVFYSRCWRAVPARHSFGESERYFLKRVQ